MGSYYNGLILPRRVDMLLFERHPGKAGNALEQFRSSPTIDAFTENDPKSEDRSGSPPTP